MNFPHYFRNKAVIDHPHQQLFKASLNTGVVPLDPKRAIITPIYKVHARINNPLPLNRI